MQLADSLVRCGVGGVCCVHNLLSARDPSWQGHEAHPADHGVEGEELLNPWLVAQDGIAICFRCGHDKVLVEVVSPRKFVGEPPGPRLVTYAQPSRETRCQAADHRTGKCR